MCDKFLLDKDTNSDNYKSCFARSVVVNSQHHFKNKQPPGKQLRVEEDDSDKGGDTARAFVPDSASSPIGGLRRDSFLNDSRRSSGSISRRSSSVCSSRIAEMPVENLVLKSQIETLQWQLKQTEESREMYKAVMKEVAVFLERAHRSLQMLGSKIGGDVVSRAQSDFSIVGMQTEEACEVGSMDYSSLKDYTWRRQKKPHPQPEEIPPQKLSQEAFRLLRTAQSLLNTAAPDLAQLNVDKSADIQFLEQLSKEFPRTHPDDTESLSSLQYTTPSDIIRISTAFNRKLSLQQTSTSHQSVKNKSPISSVSSAEDESGFSSMNSFQELGIPVKDTTSLAKDALLNSMLQPPENKLWQKTATHSHRRWSSIPVNTRLSEEEPLKVLWV